MCILVIHMMAINACLLSNSCSGFCNGFLREVPDTLTCLSVFTKQATMYVAYVGWSACGAPVRRDRLPVLPRSPQHIHIHRHTHTHFPIRLFFSWTDAIWSPKTFFFELPGKSSADEELIAKRVRFLYSLPLTPLLSMTHVHGHGNARACRQYHLPSSHTHKLPYLQQNHRLEHGPKRLAFDLLCPRHARLRHKLRRRKSVQLK
jgi:hypothetical protein